MPVWVLACLWGASAYGSEAVASAAGDTSFKAAIHKLGHEASVEQIAAWNIDVRPDGQGLPDGRGSVSDGEALYDAKCAACHGTFGESQEYMALAGGVGSLGTSAPQRTVGSKLDYATTLFDYINRAMPFPNSKSLSADEVYALTAYVLQLNNIIPADTVLDRESLPKVKMPNRDGYTSQHGFGSLRGKADVRNTACMQHCESDVKIQSALPVGFTAQFYGDISDNFRRYDIASVSQRVGADSVSCVAGRAGCAASSDPPIKMIESYSCTVCHAVDHRIVGPAYREVAARYATTANAEAVLLAKLHAGGSGNWGEIPMPSQSAVPEADLKSIVHWILEMKK